MHTYTALPSRSRDTTPKSIAKFLFPQKEAKYSERERTVIEFDVFVTKAKRGKTRKTKSVIADTKEAFR